MKITVLTDPIPTKYEYKKELLKNKLRPVKRFFDGKKPLIKPNWGGHSAVTRSLCQGLQKLSVEFNYNPQEISNIFDNIIVVSGIDTLEQAITLKKTGRIKKLFAGPNLVITPEDNYNLITSEHIDKYIVNSNWTKEMYVQCAPELSKKIAIWPAGVDTEEWKPLQKQERKTLLFYSKRPEKKIFEGCLKLASNFGYGTTVLNYGNYSTTEYFKLLSGTDFLVHFVEQESQGISLLESWAMDVPTLVWNPGIFQYRNKNYEASSAPYLTEQTGRFFRDLHEFTLLLHQEFLDLSKYSPRKWVLENMTDKICAQKLIELYNE
jgi:glycosyltransferase involved in cell wall biosynthesis